MVSYWWSLTIVSAALRFEGFFASRLRDFSPLVLIQPPEHRLEDEKLWKSKARPAGGYSMLFFEAMCAELSSTSTKLELIETAINQNHLSFT
jgi:hypothetical protein